MPLSSVHREALLGLLAGAGEARFDEPLSRHTTLRVGGPVDAWIAPASIAGVMSVRRYCASVGLPCRALGSGSNLLVLDGGVRGVLLATEKLRGLSFGTATPDDPRIPVTVEAGVSTGKLLSEAVRRCLGGIEFLGGVPGSIGGGLIMNAGTYLGEFKDVTVEVASVSESGELIHRPHAACGFVYRGSALPPTEVVVSARLLLPPRDRAAIEADVAALRKRRREREPHGVGCAGSFFKNPTGDYAGRLIEACGLKGTRSGDAEIAAAHANWLVNVGSAKASDFVVLIELARQSVRERFGVSLELEVKIIGEPE
jgi:UDP-N-acetylmuramate dehydrogenase